MQRWGCSLSLSLPELIPGGCQGGRGGPDMPDTGRHAGTGHTGAGIADTALRKHIHVYTCMCSDKHPKPPTNAYILKSTLPYAHTEAPKAAHSMGPCTDADALTTNMHRQHALLTYIQDQRQHQHLCKNIHRHTGLQHECQMDVAVISKAGCLEQVSAGRQRCSTRKVHLGPQRSVGGQQGLLHTPCSSGQSFQECVCS